ncbi:MAG: hypothetical protein IJ560_03020 [Alphaproteobacteria bacterium]|nr:hypothetical protein [Alphaproteobacteria bacterium]
MTGKLSSSVFYVLFGLMLFWANANAELPENVKFCIPKQYRVTYDCPAGGNAPTQQTTAYGNNFTTGVGCNNAPAWRVDDSDTIITSNTTIPYAYTHDIVLHADYSPWYTIAGGRLINADADVYLNNNLSAYASYGIDTGVMSTNNIGWAINFTYEQFRNSETPEHIIGTMFPHFYCGIDTAHTGFLCACGPEAGYGNGIENYTNMIVGKKYNLLFNYNNSGKIIFDYTTNLDLSCTELNNTIGNTIRLFRSTSQNVNATSTNNYSMAKIYDVKISDGQTMIRNFVAVPSGLRIGNYIVPKNGMFDIVEQKFYQPVANMIYGRD